MYRMAIRFFDGEDNSSPDTVDWLKDVILSGGDYETPRMVYQCSIGLKGVIVITSHWKAFLFRGSKLYLQLVDALPEYLKHVDGLPQLIAVGTKDGKCRLGLNTEVDIMYWVKDGESYFQKYNTGDGDTVSLAPVNPLLPSPIPPNRTMGNTTASPKGKATKSS